MIVIGFVHCQFIRQQEEFLVFDSRRMSNSQYPWGKCAVCRLLHWLILKLMMIRCSITAKLAPQSGEDSALWSSTEAEKSGAKAVGGCACSIAHLLNRNSGFTWNATNTSSWREVLHVTTQSRQQTLRALPTTTSWTEIAIQAREMKVWIKEWHAVAAWRWQMPEDDVCGICRNPYDSTCSKCKFPGDECPLCMWISAPLFARGHCANSHLPCRIYWQNR